MKTRMPNFFIIGPPKCGTTSMAAWLGEHPNIYMSPVKEPTFYCEDLHLWRTSPSEYKQLFSGATDAHRVIGEASVYYLFSKVAVPKIESEIPNPRYLVMVRNPVDMAYSFHEQLVVSGVENITDFAKAWHLSGKRTKVTFASEWCHDPKLLNYKAVCRLGEQIQRLFATVPRERVLVLVLDDVKENPRREYLKVLDFLGLPDDGRTDFPVKNPAKELKWPKLRQAILVAGRMSTKLKQSLGIPKIKGTGILTKLTQLNTRYRPRPPLSTELRRELQDYFRDDVMLLSELLNRDLSMWVESGE